MGRNLNGMEEVREEQRKRMIDIHCLQEDREDMTPG